MAKIPANVWDGIKKRREVHTRRRELTVEELGRVVTRLKGEMRVLFAVGIYTGLRLGDCSMLEWFFATCKAQERPSASLLYRAHWNRHSRPCNIHWSQWQMPDRQKVQEEKAVSPSEEMRLFIARTVVFRDVVFGGICKRHKAK